MMAESEKKPAPKPEPKLPDPSRPNEARNDQPPKKPEHRTRARES